MLQKVMISEAKITAIRSENGIALKFTDYQARIFRLSVRHECSESIEDAVFRRELFEAFDCYDSFVVPLRMRFATLVIPNDFSDALIRICRLCSMFAIGDDSKWVFEQVIDALLELDFC